jgi:hypothetical protein
LAIGKGRVSKTIKNIHNMEKTLTMPDIETLGKIRTSIILAMSLIGLLINVDYKLSKVDTDNPSIVFRIQILNANITPGRIKSAIKKTFYRLPTYQDSSVFMRIKTEKEYLYLLNLKTRKKVG